MIVVCAAIVSAIIAHYYFRPDPVIRVTTLDEWNSITKETKCILFVDGDWNIEMVAFREPFREFAEWSRSQDIRPVTLTISDEKDDAWKICQELWNQIPEARSQHGLKHFGGAGRVVWLENGNVVDYAWCVFLTNWEEIGDIDQLKKRTQNTFR